MTDLSQFTDEELDAARVALDQTIEDQKAQLAEMNAEAGRRSLAAHEAVQAALTTASADAGTAAPEGAASVVSDSDVVH